MSPIAWYIAGFATLAAGILLILLIDARSRRDTAIRQRDEARKELRTARQENAVLHLDLAVARGTLRTAGPRRSTIRHPQPPAAVDLEHATTAVMPKVASHA